MLRLALTLAALVAPGIAAAQVYVGPRRPGQSSVRYQPHHWMRADLLDGASLLDSEAGGVRLYYYEQEAEVAERAAATVETAYRDLSEAFGYVPEHPFAYVLYSTYLDFLSTNLFPVQEGTLGVTSTRNLTIALPYFGDHRRFAEVSKHEMAHEFTIQKVRSAAAAAGVARDPLGVFPLWFIEGLAEFYAHDALTDEAAMLARDLVVNADTRRFWGPLGFFDDAPGSVLWTYQLGHLRCRFLADRYGDDVIQELLSRGHEAMGVTFSGKTALRGFPALVHTVTGDEPRVVEQHWQEWLRERTYAAWLDSETYPSSLEPIRATRGYVLGMTANPSGDLVAYTAIDFETYRTRVMLADPRDAGGAKVVVSDSRPGVESLHPVESGTIALGDDVIVYTAQHRGADVLSWRTIERDVREYRGRRARKRAERTEGELPPRRIRLHTGSTQRLHLRDHGLVAATGLSLSPDGSQLAFVGLTPAGRTDVYTVALAEGAVPVRISDDPFAERHTTWTPDGVVYASDATANGHFALFRARAGSEPVQITGEGTDHLQPIYSDGRLLFTAWSDERMDLHERLDDGTVVRRTRSSTALSSPAPLEDGAWALLQDSGSRVPTQVPNDVWLDGAPRHQQIGGLPAPPTTRALTDAAAYRPLDPKNWRLENGLGYFGAGPGGLYGQLFLSASDTLRDRGLVLSAAAFGSLRLTDGYLAYMDQSHRLTWGGGLFQALRFRIDTSTDLRFQSAERSYGVLGTVRLPFDRFAYAQVDTRIGGTQYFLLDGTESILRGSLDEQTGETLLTTWERQNGTARPQAEITARLGYDTVRYHPTTGPHGGGSALAELSWAVQPFDGQQFGHGRLDAERFVPIRIRGFSGANLFFRGSAGSSFGGIYARNFFLSSFDTLRGVRFADPDWLLGRHYATATTEVQVPLDALLRIAILSSVEAIAGVDAGAVATDPTDLWDKRVLDVALGTNLVFGPLVFRVHFARPLDIGTDLPATGRGPWVPNMSLRWLSL